MSQANIRERAQAVYRKSDVNMGAATLKHHIARDIMREQGEGTRRTRRILICIENNEFGTLSH